MQNEHNDTALHVAARHGMVEVVKALVECLRTKAELNKDGMTPLHLVGSAEIVQILLLRTALERRRYNLRRREGILRC